MYHICGPDCDVRRNRSTGHARRPRGAHWHLFDSDDSIPPATLTLSDLGGPHRPGYGTSASQRQNRRPHQGLIASTWVMVGRQERRYPHSHAGDGQLSGHLVLAIPKGGSCRERRRRRSTWGAFVTLTADCIAEFV